MTNEGNKFRSAKELLLDNAHQNRSQRPKQRDWDRIRDARDHPYKANKMQSANTKKYRQFFRKWAKKGQADSDEADDADDIEVAPKSKSHDTPSLSKENFERKSIDKEERIRKLIMQREEARIAREIKIQKQRKCEEFEEKRRKVEELESPPDKNLSDQEKSSAAQPFKPPFKRQKNQLVYSQTGTSSNADDEDGKTVVQDEVKKILEDPRSKNLDANIVGRILSEILSEKSKSIGWQDIAGLDFAKSSINEIVILPMLKPELFVGLLAPSKGLLLFGPPGTGKTLIGKCIASQSNSTFFSISASSLTSKWIGEGEKLVRALFAVARIRAPSVIFIDEIDSLLTQRCDTEHESSRRMKTEFLVQFDGLNTEQEERLLVIGATNRPHELDEAARRRFTKRLYIPLPDGEARGDLIQKLLKTENHQLTQSDFEKLCTMTDGYSGADICSLCKEAAMGPIRKVGLANLHKYNTKESLPPIVFDDFAAALHSVKASVAEKDLSIYLEWNKKYGSVRYNKT